MSLNGMMGIGLSGGGTQNPWDASSPAAVDFRRSEETETKGEGKTDAAPSAPADYVTLHSREVQVGSAAATSNAAEVGSRFRTVA